LLETNLEINDTNNSLVIIYLFCLLL